MGITDHWVYHTFTVIGSLGGILFFALWWIERPRLRIEIVRREYDQRADLLKLTTDFDITNIGYRPTSLPRSITFVGYNPDGNESRERLELHCDDRKLPPHEPKRVSVKREISAEINYPFLNFHRYEFRLSRFKSAVRRFRSDRGEPLGPIAYFLESRQFLHQTTRDQVER